MVESALGWGGIDFNNESLGANVGDLGIPMISPVRTIKGKRTSNNSSLLFRAWKLSRCHLCESTEEWTILVRVS